jgi:hypothetical protein
MIRMWGDEHANELYLIISQYIHISKHHIVYHKYVDFYLLTKTKNICNI